MRHLLPVSWSVCKTWLDVERKEVNTMKKYVSPCMSAIELSVEDIITTSDLSRLYQAEGDVIDSVIWNS